MKTNAEFKFWISHLDRQNTENAHVTPHHVIKRVENSGFSQRKNKSLPVLIAQSQAITDDLVTEATQQINRRRKETDKIATAYIHQVHVTNPLRWLCCLRHVLGILDWPSFVHPRFR
jgi:hypothetical protein